jgi:nucleoside-diphosphate-sugar epimerase
MKVLFIGGTGTISSSITRQLAENKDYKLTILNRGSKNKDIPPSVRQITGDINNEAEVTKLLASETFDVVGEFVAYTPEQIKRDIRIFGGRCGQYIFISSASAYQKPLSHYVITESTPLSNPYWQYSRDKIACEQVLMDAYRNQGFPITIIRPSHTYADGSIPLAIHGEKGPWSELKRMLDGKPVIVPGDGSSLWTVTHSADFAKAYIGLLGNPHALGEAVHITSDESLTWNQIYHSVGQALGVKPKIVHIATDTLVALRPSLEGPLLGDKSNTVAFDNSKIKRLVPEFCAAIRFDQGIRQSLSYLLRRPELQIPDPEWDAWVDTTIGLASPSAFSK